MSNKPTTWDRLRFKANEDDYRPVLWPPIGPYWCSGSGGGYSIIVAYVPHKTTVGTLKKYWPEAEDVDVMQEDTSLEYSDRFPEPKWWKAL